MVTLIIFYEKAAICIPNKEKCQESFKNLLTEQQQIMKSFNKN